nr:Glyco_hydro_2 [uncultured Clostridium sp.]
MEDQDFWRFSGIFRDVYLYAIPKTHLQDIFIKHELINDYTTGSLDIEAKIQGEINETTISFILRDKNRKVIYETYVEGKNEVKLAANVGAVLPWSAEQPNLYTLEIAILHDSALVEVVSQKIGFRTFEMKDGLMLLNGSELFQRREPT